MPSGVIFIVCIPTSNYEHILKFGEEKSLVPIEDEYKPIRMAVELRDKNTRSNSIPIHLTHNYYNATFNTRMENITEENEFFTMENVSTQIIFIRVTGATLFSKFISKLMAADHERTTSDCSNKLSLVILGSFPN